MQYHNNMAGRIKQLCASLSSLLLAALYMEFPFRENNNRPVEIKITGQFKSNRIALARTPFPDLKSFMSTDCLFLG